jgi:hypothetical protein
MLILVGHKVEQLRRARAGAAKEIQRWANLTWL